MPLRWSPDGKWLATGFTYDCEEGCGIHLIDIDHRKDHLVVPEGEYKTPPNYHEFVYSWNASSDSVITAISDGQDLPFQEDPIVTIGISEFSITDTGNMGVKPMYSPIGDDYAFVKCEWPNHYYYVMKADATEPTLVTTAPIGNPFDCDAQYLWSRDGKSLIYATTKEILSVDVDTTVKRVILKMNSYYTLGPEHLSLDSKYLAFHYGPRNAPINPGFVNLETGEYVLLSKSGGLFWTKDNQLFLYSYSEDGTRSTYSVDLAIGALTSIDIPEWAGYPIQP